MLTPRTVGLGLAVAGGFGVAALIIAKSYGKAKTAVVKSKRPWNLGPPADGVLKATSGWGADRDEYGTHTGLDIPLPKGTPLKAMAEGVVVSAPRSLTTPGGYVVSIQYNNGLVALYAHLDRPADVAPGQSVKRGQTVGISGSTGYSAGPHVHIGFTLDPAYLPLYVASFGTPSGGFPAARSGLIPVPPEPLIPVASYSQTVVAMAADHGIPLYQA